MRTLIGMVCVSAVVALAGCKKEEAAKTGDKTAAKTADAGAVAQTPTPTPTPTPAPMAGDAGAMAAPDKGSHAGHAGHGNEGNEKIMSATDEQEALGVVNALADEICACKDHACAEAVMAKAEVKMKKWENFKPGPEGEKKLGEIVTKMTGCMEKLPPAPKP